MFQRLVGATNKYLEKKEADKSSKPVVLLVRDSAMYVTHMFKIFGLLPNGTDIGFPVGSGGESESKEKTLEPFLDAILEFRADIRAAARSKNFEELLGLCDSLRDSVLPDLGVQLEDKEGSKGVWKLANSEDIKRMKEQKALEAAKKAEVKAAREKAAEEKARLNRMPPEDFLKQLTLEDGETAMYSKFGDDGLPTHAADGEELNKNQVKKAKKLFDGQKKKYEKAISSGK